MPTFRCSRCRVPITTRVQPLQDSSLVTGEEGTNIFPPGWFANAGKLIRQLGYSEGDRSLGEPDELIFNLDDLRNTRLGGTLNGCCGIDGSDGVNTFCINGHEIGTERSDCWTLRFIHIPPINVVAEA